MVHALIYGNLTHIANKQYTQAQLVLGITHTQIFHQSLKFGCSVVVAINVVHQIHQYDQRHDQGVNLPPELFLDDLLFRR